MSIDLEYAIKKDVRNNPIVRAVDASQGAALLRTGCLVGAVVALVLFSALQHFAILDNSYKVEDLYRERAVEERANRQLRLEVETLRAPQRIERLAVRDLAMSAPSATNTLVIERAVPAEPDSSVVAAAR